MTQAGSRCLVHPQERRAWWSRPLAIANADAKVLREQLNWGPVDRVFEPAAWRRHVVADQLSSTSRRRPRLVLVDANSGWARLPPADYQPRVMASADRQRLCVCSRCAPRHRVAVDFTR